jgi:hypothetical protein
VLVEVEPLLLLLGALLEAGAVVVVVVEPVLVLVVPEVFPEVLLVVPEPEPLFCSSTVPVPSGAAVPVVVLPSITWPIEGWASGSRGVPKVWMPSRLEESMAEPSLTPHPARRSAARTASRVRVSRLWVMGTAPFFGNIIAQLHQFEQSKNA